MGRAAGFQEREVREVGRRATERREVVRGCVMGEGEKRQREAIDGVVVAAAIIGALGAAQQPKCG